MQGVIVAERILQRREAVRRRRQALDGADVGAFGLHRKREAGTRRHTVDLHRAGAADAMLAADMRAGRAEHMADEIAQQHARFGEARRRRGR